MRTNTTGKNDCIDNENPEGVGETLGMESARLLDEFEATAMVQLRHDEDVITQKSETEIRILGFLRAEMN